MTDMEIRQYLNHNNYSVTSQNCIMDILNTSRQIIEEKYDSSNQRMMLRTPENVFTFQLVLGRTPDSNSKKQRNNCLPNDSIV